MRRAAPQSVGLVDPDGPPPVVRPFAALDASPLPEVDASLDRPGGASPVRESLLPPSFVVVGASPDARAVSVDASPASPPPSPVDPPGRAARASFFAQPDPLKTIVGGESALRIEPPHRSQCDGPVAWIPWTTSVR
jgi:hypothetical protein